MTPHATVFERAVASMVTVNGSAGYFGITAAHVPIVSELRPGLVTVHDVVKGGEDKTPRTVHLFASGGFVFVHADSTCDVTALECVDVKDLDPQAVRDGLEAAQKALASAAEGIEQDKARVAVEVHEAMAFALAESGISK